MIVEQLAIRTFKTLFIECQEPNKIMICVKPRVEPHGSDWRAVISNIRNMLIPTLSINHCCLASILSKYFCQHFCATTISVLPAYPASISVMRSFSPAGMAHPCVAYSVATYELHALNSLYHQYLAIYIVRP